MALGSGREKPGKTTTGKRPAVKTGEFKVARTSPIIKARDPDALEAAPTAAAGAEAETGAAATVPGVDAATGVDSAATTTDAAEPVAKTASGKKPKITSGKTPAVKTTSARKAVPGAAAATVRVRAGDQIWITCRECMEEWTIEPERAKSQETIACPICEHRAQAPSDDIIHQIALYKGIEKRNLQMAVISFLAGVLAMLGWTVLTTNPNRAADFTFFTLPIIVAVIALVATLFFANKYENSKWETYF